MSEKIIAVKEVAKSFIVGTQEMQILKGVSLEIEVGDFTVIVGPSGCGKSTLLHIILGLEVPSQGEVVFLGESIYNSTDEDYRSSFRKKHIGMVYQQPNWIKSMNVSENVAFPLMLLGMDKNEAVARAMELLATVKMVDWATHKPTELSGGQQQRIALARSLANNPEIIIADEPTGNLDFQSGQEVMELLRNLNIKEGKTIVMVTHDLEYLKYAKSAIRMLDGQITHAYKQNEISSLLKEFNFKRGSEALINTVIQGKDEKNGRSVTQAPTLPTVTVEHVDDEPKSNVSHKVSKMVVQKAHKSTQPKKG